LIDAAMLKYKPSLTVAALISASLEIYFNLKYEERLKGIKKMDQENFSINQNNLFGDITVDHVKSLPYLEHLK